MHTFTVCVVVIDENQQSTDQATVDADYYTTEGEFVTFKDAEHKQIASFHTRNVVSVTRAERKTTIGTVVVNVAPELDEDAMGRLVDEITRRVNDRRNIGGVHA